MTMTGQLSFFPSAPVDDGTASLLALLNGDPIHDGDRQRICQAIRDTALTNNGRVNPNVVRRRLTYNGALMVYPRIVGAVYHSLARAGVLVPDGWTVSDDRSGGNRGKPARLYRLVTP